ncbi:MinD/ParA family protein [Arthrobacter sp. ZGTC131]|uniref:MinD/ParA family ATP-binding protein n=1 Tax=Arthrobacter sp. ZGTC131 TaxID=2058898 RepID=UPI000CE42975|nr:MinD/ParA family protein [Arthrobacter sp. ZGTC131]
MTQTNTPKPAPRPDRSPRAAAPAPEQSPEQVGPVQQSPEQVGPEQQSPAQHSPDQDAVNAGEATGAPSGEISVVTVSDAQDRTSAGSLSAVNSIPRPAAAPALPAVTSGPGLVTGPAETGAEGFPAVGSPVQAAAQIPIEQVPGDTLAPPEPAAEQALTAAPAPEHVSERRERAEGPEPAAALTADRLLNKTPAAPVEGWRRWLFQATFGYVNLGDPDGIRIQRAMEHRIAMRLGERTRYVPVLSRKGGVGKTTVTTLLGMVLADLREDRVIAMDANPDRGTLSDRSPGRADFTARQLVKDRFTVNSFAQLSNYTARDGSRLDVLASDTDPMVAHAFDDADYRAVTDILGRYYSIVLTDSGTGMVHSVMKGTLEKADAVVLVSGGSVDEARLASETLSWLEAHGRQDLVAKATVVINMAAGDRTLVNIDEIEQHFLSRVKNVVRIPHDRHLAEGSRIQLSQLRPATRGAAVELAALVMDELQQA